MFNLRSNVLLDGRCDLYASGLVTVAMPEATASEDGTSRAVSKFGGTWLVESVTHVITRETHQTKLELLKNKATTSVSK